MVYPYIRIKGYVIGVDYQGIDPRFVEKIERTNKGMFTLDCHDLEDAMIFSDENQAKTWCLIINKELEDKHIEDKYIPLRYMSALQELEEDKTDE